MIKGKSSEKGSGGNQPEGSVRGNPKKEKDRKKPTRIIVRNLPPSMTEAQFIEQTSPVPPHDNFYIAPPDLSLGTKAASRAYLTFKNHDDVALFRDRFNGYVFVDSRGWEYEASVEIAPFQGFPATKSRKSDVEVNTIQENAHYLQFIEKKKNKEN